MRSINELHDDLLVKILSFVPAKEVVATSALSKRWYCLWKQLDDVIDYVELCGKCSLRWIRPLIFHSPKYRSDSWRLGLGEQPNFVSMISRLKANACVGCKGRIHAEKEVTMIIILDAKYMKKQAVIWTKLEEKQEMLIELVITRETILNYRISVT
ncbi:unnamed protein product [Arabis nemorensis]|uniref:F-box domain-containing protein n=1 Tax=Arabis nemorensis TaxID=586526 RepID=A0A565B3W8_9BRAS|nr:unnamed protein product [Arabis nemorensis]